jgi:hypothetical protein
MTRYELWMHRHTSTCYAVRLTNGQVSGACGPLRRADLSRRQAITATEYEDVVVTGRLEAGRPLFAVIDAWTDSPEERLEPGDGPRIQWQDTA